MKHQPRLLFITAVLALLPLLLPAQPSRIELCSMYSAIQGTQKNFNVYFPEGYDSENSTYPVLYLFRGHEREWANPTEDGSRRGTIKTVADSLYAAGRIGKMLLIMPGLNAPASDADFQYVIGELIPYVDSHFRTIPTRGKRGMDGFSYGGLSVMQLLWRAPQFFSTAGTYDGSFWAFDMSLLANASPSYWSTVATMRHLHHAASNSGVSNYPNVAQFIAILQGHGIENGFSPFMLTPEAQHNWYFADLHMAYALPLHWQKFRMADQFQIQLSSTEPAGTVNGTINLAWTLPTAYASLLRSVVQSSRDDGISWTTVASPAVGTTQCSINTLLLPDGTRYRLRIQSMNDTLLGAWESTSSFTINNPGNGTPDIVLRTPRAGTALSGTVTVQWTAADADGDPLQISLLTSVDNGMHWQTLASTVANTGSYSWNTIPSANSPSYKLKILGSDGTSNAADSSGVFTVYNARSPAEHLTLTHRSGKGTPDVRCYIVDPAALTGHLYRLTVNAPVSGEKTYSIYDVTASAQRVNGAAALDGLAEGPLFDGMRLLIRDYPVAAPNPDSSRWLTGASTWTPAVSIPSFELEGHTYTGFPYPADYRIRIADHIVDTSRALFGADAVPIYFQVWNSTDNHAVKIVFADQDGDQKLSPLDDLVLLEEDSLHAPLMTWEIILSAGTKPVAPVPGDELLIRINRPLTSADVFEFRVPVSNSVQTERNALPAENTLEPNFPNPFNPATTIRFNIAERSRVQLRVYDVLGREVAVVANAVFSPGTHSLQWNAGALASGMYLIRMDTSPLHAPGRITLLTQKALLLR